MVSNLKNFESSRVMDRVGQIFEKSRSSQFLTNLNLIFEAKIWLKSSKEYISLNFLGRFRVEYSEKIKYKHNRPDFWAKNWGSSEKLINVNHLICMKSSFFKIEDFDPKISHPRLALKGELLFSLDLFLFLPQSNNLYWCLAPTVSGR